MVDVKQLVYTIDDEVFEGVLIAKDGGGEKLPGVMIAHAFFGLSDLDIANGKRLAELGYAVFVCDYYGQDVRPKSQDDAMAQMQALNADRQKLLRRMAGSLQTLKDQECVDASRTAALGFCFGGKAVLDLARSGADMSAAISIHGVFDAPDWERKKMACSVLACHGWNDHLAPPEQFNDLAAELDEVCEDWQFTLFGHTGHAFTNPGANVPEIGMHFNPNATRRSWAVIDDYLSEKLSRSA